jgi:hypothetical protein
MAVFPATTRGYAACGIPVGRRNGDLSLGSIRPPASNPPAGFRRIISFDACAEVALCCAKSNRQHFAMTRKQEIPDLEGKVLLVGKRHELGATANAVAERVGFSPRTLNEAMKGEPVKGKKGLTTALRNELAACLGVGHDWVEWFDGQYQGRDELAAFVTKYDTNGVLPPCLQPKAEPAAKKTAPPPSFPDLSSRRTGPAWALDAQLCGVTLLGGQYQAADLDFEVSGQPTRLTITDETGLRIIMQREIVVKHCILELDLGGAELHGGLTAMKRAVDTFLKGPEGAHLFVTVSGSATTPRLTIQARDGAIGLFRPLVNPGSHDGEPEPLCWLAGVLPDTELVARVRMYGAELQDRPVEETGLAGASGPDDDVPRPIARAKGAELSTDDRVKLMRRLWEMAKANEQNPDRMEPGVITLAFDVRKYDKRQ